MWIFWYSSREDAWLKAALHSTHLGPSACVRQVVLCQVRAVAEGSAAVPTGVGPLTCVHVPVLSQVLHLRDGLGTLQV